MADDGSYQWLLGALVEHEPQNTQDMPQRAAYEHPAFADAGRIAWQALMRSQRMSPQSGPNFQQRAFNVNTPPFDYYSPHARREPQVAESQSPVHGFQGQWSQSRDSPIQQYVTPSDVSLSPASNNPTTDHLPSRSSAPIEMFAHQPTMATHRPPRDMNQVRESLALAEYAQRLRGRTDQPVVPLTTQPATLDQRSNVEVTQNWPVRHSGGQHFDRNSSQTRSPASDTPTTSQYTGPYTSVSHIALGPRTHTPSTSQNPSPTVAAPTVSGHHNGTSSASRLAIASPSLQQLGARRTHVSSPRQQALPQSTSARLEKNNVPTDIQSSRGKNSPDLHIHSGLPVRPTTMNSSSKDHGLAHRIRLQTSENGPPFKIRRVEDGTKRTATPANSSVSPMRVPSDRKHLLAHPGMARPVDAREAAIKISYDPATIARDVLISVNRHPTEKYLNHHLDVLRRFAAVDLSTDLDTFRWDLVDPDNPCDHNVQRPAAPRAASETRVPNQQPPASSVAPLPFPDKPPSFPSFTRPIPPPALHTSLPSTGQPQFARFHLSRPPPSAPTQDTPEPEKSSTSAPTPPIAPPPISSKAKPATPTTSTTSQPPQLSPTPARATSSKAPSLSLRNKSYPDPQVVIEASPDVMPPQKRKPGRPRKGGKQVEVAIQNEPSVPFPVFRCAWSKCQSELHNMDALQSHVLKVHIPHEITCGWEGCDNQTPMAASKLWAHVQEKHLQSVAWALGDGPSVPPIGMATGFAISNLMGSSRGS